MEQAVVAAILVLVCAACGGGSAAPSCDDLGPAELRRNAAFLDENPDLSADTRRAGQALSQAFASARVATCKRDHWSAQAIACDVSATDGERCGRMLTQAQRDAWQAAYQAATDDVQRRRDQEIDRELAAPHPAPPTLEAAPTPDATPAPDATPGPPGGGIPVCVENLAMLEKALACKTLGADNRARFERSKHDLEHLADVATMSADTRDAQIFDCKAAVTDALPILAKADGCRL
jgi:hypothetical protein